LIARNTKAIPKEEMCIEDAIQKNSKLNNNCFLDLSIREIPSSKKEAAKCCLMTFTLPKKAVEVERNIQLAKRVNLFFLKKK